MTKEQKDSVTYTPFKYTGKNYKMKPNEIKIIDHLRNKIAHYFEDYCPFTHPESGLSTPLINVEKETKEFDIIAMICKFPLPYPLTLLDKKDVDVPKGDGKKTITLTLADMSVKESKTPTKLTVPFKMGASLDEGEVIRVKGLLFE
jgi:hypothetical protein